MKNIQIIQGDITTAKVDVIVNAANRELIPGGGVDGAIHHAAGPQLEHDVHQHAPLDMGEVLITSGYHLPSPYVMHVVGPKWYDYANQEDAKEFPRKTYQAILNALLEQGYTSIAIPNISTGFYGFPKEEAVKIVYEVMLHNESRLKEHHTIDFYCFDEVNYLLYRNVLD